MDGMITSNDDALNAQERRFKIRRKAREMALQGLYALELTEANPSSVQVYLKSYHKDYEAAFDFAFQLIGKTFAKRIELDEHIKRHASNWEFGRIALIDRLVLRLAVCEFLDFWDIPPKVTIDEAIELSKQFSTEQSGGFVNGVLDAILCDLKKENLIVKSGRGLQEDREAHCD